MLLVATVVVALLAMLAVWLSGAVQWLRLVLTFAAAGVGGMAAGNLLRPRIRSLLWRSEGGVDLVLNDTLADGRHEVRGAIQGARVMGPLIVLTVRWPPRERATIWLLSDNLDTDVLRRLRMRLGAQAGDGFASGNADSG